jgi:aflatoxin B1 aldehyde reductase
MTLNQDQLIQMYQDVYNIRMAEVAQRWLQHHSALQPGDAVILGAASPQQMEDNIVQWCVPSIVDDAIRTSFSSLHSEGGPLPDEIVKLLEGAWQKAKAVAPHYAM